ncbi:hypothetical protein BC941DRAFT_455896 [Chlamydoabsidia padenii]|nr:hypothetical protein BC941DRAFT_455896 [Chlamydoabsidia padenii]
MYTLTSSVDPSIMPTDSPPQNQPSFATGWKTSIQRKSCQLQPETWKTTSAFTSPYQQHRQFRPLPHVPAPPPPPPPLDQSTQEALYHHHHRQSLPAGGFMNESFQYNQTEAYASTPSLHQYYHQQDYTNNNTHPYYQQQWPTEQSFYDQQPFYDQQHTYDQQPGYEQQPSYEEQSYHDPQPDLPTTQPKDSPTKEKKPSSERNVRQITVRSVNEEHRVWIDISPTETGLSLAAKIHRIATFGTRKVLKITTTQGRIIPLDNRPIFGSWMDMTSFENGEHWQVEWGSLDRSMVDKFFAKVIQVGGARQKNKKPVGGL